MAKDVPAADKKQVFVANQTMNFQHYKQEYLKIRILPYKKARNGAVKFWSDLDNHMQRASVLEVSKTIDSAAVYRTPQVANELETTTTTFNWDEILKKRNYQKPKCSLCTTLHFIMLSNIFRYYSQCASI